MIWSYKENVDYGVDTAGGFGGNIGHDPHILYTLSAVQVLALFDKVDVLDIEKIANCILWYIYFLDFVINLHYFFNWPMC